MSACAACPDRPNLSAVDCLARLAGHHGLDASAEGLLARFGLSGPDLPLSRLLGMARELGLAARRVRLTYAKALALGQAFPAMALLRDGSAVILAGAEEEAGRLVVFGQGGFRPVERADLEAAWAGDVVLVRRAESSEERAFGLGWFAARMAGEKRVFLEVAAVALVMHGLAFAVPLYFQAVVDKVLAHDALTTLATAGLGVTCAVLFEGAFRYLREYMLRFAAGRMDLGLAVETFGHLLKLPLAFFERSPAGVVVKHMQQADQIREFLTGRLLGAVLDASSLLVFLPVLFLYSPRLAALVLCFSLASAVLVGALIGPFHRRLTAQYEAEGRRQALLVETVQGMATVKSLAAEPVRRGAWEDGSARAVACGFRVETMAAAAQAAIRTLERLMTVAVIFLGAQDVIAGGLSVGCLIAFQMLSGSVSQPLIRLVECVHEYQRTHLAVAMLGEIMNRAPERSSGGACPALAGGVSLREATFAYAPGQTPALDRVSLDVAPGEVLGVMGRSGSGKTTLTRLVQGLSSPQSGEVLFDGRPLRELDLAHLRSSIGVVLQDNFIFHGTVRENIALTRPRATPDQVREAARLAGAEDFILRLPKGYDTVLDENGSNLSGGQRQRLAIARALLRDPRIVIFDEATSALDPESEAVIQENMAAIARGRTLIIVAHRLSALRRADRIVVMDAGRILDVGRHEDLLGRCDLYRNLWETQTRGMQ